VTIKEVHSLSHKKEIKEQGAANFAENEKKKKYVDFEKKNGCVVVPFGISSAGEFGNNALKLLGFISKLSNKMGKPILSSKLIERISLTLETMRFFMINHYEQHCLRITSNLPSSMVGSTKLPLSPPSSIP
jgi:DNA replication protein DnaD